MNLKTFYHIAAMGDHWKNIVVEQNSILSSLDIKPICGFLGTSDDINFVYDLGLDIQYSSTNIEEYETPTLNLLYQWSMNNSDSAVLYIHTKGVSSKNDEKKLWRWLMTDILVKNIYEYLDDLNIFDIIGVNWHDKMPHFCGNFWIARSSWINQLQDPYAHKNLKRSSILGNPWERMHAEMWIGSKPNCKIKSLFCRNEYYLKYNELYRRYLNEKGDNNG